MMGLALRAQGDDGPTYVLYALAHALPTIPPGLRLRASQTLFDGPSTPALAGSLSALLCLGSIRAQATCLPTPVSGPVPTRLGRSPRRSLPLSPFHFHPGKVALVSL